MFLNPNNIQAYTYTNPGADEHIGTFHVLPTDARDELSFLPSAYQNIMYEAWVRQFDGIYSPTDIAKTVGTHVDPSDPAGTLNPHVAAQRERLLEGNKPGAPVYVHAEVKLGQYLDNVNQFCRAGIGKALVVDGRGRLARTLRDPNPQNQLADISNIFVRPELRGGGHIVGLQNNGIGSGIARTLLDGFDPDMRTVVYDYPENVPVANLLTRRLGFSAMKTWNVELFGRQVPQTYYLGPEVGMLTEIIEAGRPWLRDREPYTPIPEHYEN